MQRTLFDLMQAFIATLTFAIYLLAPGYCFLRILDRAGCVFRSREERLLWSVVLSLPLSLELAQLLGRVLPQLFVQAAFILILLIACVLCLVWRPARQEPHTQLRSTKLLYGIAAVWTSYAALALLPITWGHHIFVPTVIYDWAVRVPFVRAAMTGSVPPINPLSALDPSKPSPLRYYYFWYVLCALPARLAHVSAMSALIASVIWAGYALLSTFFLALRYLEGFTTSIRTRCLQILLPILVIGLDILPAIPRLLRPRAITLLDMEWWRSDRTPSFISTLLYAPHHLAGLSCVVTAILVLLTLVVAPTNRASASQWKRTVCASVFVGIAFAACVGTSTYIAMIFTIVCVLLCVDFLRRCDWLPILSLAASAILAYLLARPFLHELASQSSAVQAFATWGWRSHLFATQLMGTAVRHGKLASLMVEPTVFMLDFSEVGFFAFVLLNRVRHDFFQTGSPPLSPGNRALWAVMLGGLFNALFVSSRFDPASPNDLGMHAGIVVRFVLVLWSVTYLIALRKRVQFWRDQGWSSKLVIVSALLCLTLGVAGTIYSAFNNRFYFPVIEARVDRSPPHIFTEQDTSSRLFDIRSALETASLQLPATARIQFDPTGQMQPAFGFWSPRQIVAFDSGCGTAFGGDYERCRAVAPEMHALFGSQESPANDSGRMHYFSSGKTSTADELDRFCKEFSSDLILVDSTNPEWGKPDSWVWTKHPVIQNETVRAFSCSP